MANKIRTYFLFARPSFTEGFARLVDLGGTLQIYNESKTEKEADMMALWMDWLAVGDDIRNSIELYEQRSRETHPIDRATAAA